MWGHLWLLTGSRRRPIPSLKASSLRMRPMISSSPSAIFIHWEAKDDKKIQDFNYRATKEAIARAVKGEPKASTVTAEKDKVRHPFAAG
jgi:formaldehyde-activating enzyme (Fae)